MIEIMYKIDRPELQSNGYYTTYGWLIVDVPNHFEAWPVISGRYGRGTIPIGIYNVSKPIALGTQPENKAFQKEGHPWIARLTPLGNCVDDLGNRTGLLIHPDGNVEGTLGCIGVTEKDLSLYNTLNYIFKEFKQEVRLNVC